MANYKVVGNTSFSELVGGKKNAEKILKGMNITKEIGVMLGAEHNPPYIWNKNFPNGWVIIIGEAVIEKIDKDINWKPDDAFIEGLRKRCKEVL